MRRSVPSSILDLTAKGQTTRFHRPISYDVQSLGSNEGAKA